MGDLTELVDHLHLSDLGLLRSMKGCSERELHGYREGETIGI